MPTLTREDKIRERLFPGMKTFERSTGGFAALPLILRRAQFLFEPRAWQVYTYVLMRSGPAAVCWFALSEMAWDLQFNSLSKLRPYVSELERDGWIKSSQAQGKDYYIVLDPLRVIARAICMGRIPSERVDAIDELLDSLGLESMADVMATLPKDFDNDVVPRPAPVRPFIDASKGPEKQPAPRPGFGRMRKPAAATSEEAPPSTPEEGED